jgi:uncharacterized protein
MCWKAGLRRKPRLPLYGFAGLILGLAGLFAVEQARAASLNCATATSVVERAICEDPGLNELEELVVRLYRSASSTIASARRQALQEDQHKWLEERGECDGPSIRQCLSERYRARALVLEVEYGQGNSTRPLIYRCDALEHQISVAFFKTDPPAVSLSLGGSSSEPVTAVLQPSDRGEKYVAAKGLVFWAVGDQASLALATGKEAACRLM